MTDRQPREVIELAVKGRGLFVWQQTRRLLLSKQLALIYSYVEVRQTCLAILRELKDNVEQLQENQRASDAYLQELCQRITKLVDEKILIRSLLKDR